MNKKNFSSLGISVNIELADFRAVSGDFSEDLFHVGHRLTLSLSSCLALVGQKYSGLCVGNFLHHSVLFCLICPVKSRS